MGHAAMSKAQKQKGTVVKLSPEVIAYINPKRRYKKGTKSESYDSALRRFFGLPTVRGEAQSLRNYFIIDNGGEPLAFADKAEARGTAVIRAVRKGHKKAEAVIAVREMP